MSITLLWVSEARLFNVDLAAFERDTVYAWGPKVKNLLSLWLYSLRGPWPLFQFLSLYTAGRTPWAGDQPVARSLPTHRTTQTRNKRTQKSMLRVGFEATIPVFERMKTVNHLSLKMSILWNMLISNVESRQNATDPVGGVLSIEFAYPSDYNLWFLVLSPFCLKVL
jgi:hypothetical protein